jgi:hypothetical protein
MAFMMVLKRDKELDEFVLRHLHDSTVGVWLRKLKPRR